MNENFEHIASLLQKTIDKRAKLKQAVERVERKDLVKEILGEALMKYVDSISIRETVIVIGTQQSVLRQEIKMQEKEILSRLHRLMGEEYFTAIRV